MQHINVEILQQLLEIPERDFLLVDVREFFEHEIENIGGVCMPLSQLNNYLTKLPESGKVIVYCKRGVRSQIAIQRLQDKFPAIEFMNVVGGIEAFKKLV